MSHINNFKSMLTIAVVVGVAFAAPNKDKSELSNEIAQSGSFITKNGDSVSASFGGFHAAASLADDGSAMASAGGNGLGASSGYGPGGAGAGAGFVGVSEFASAGIPMKPATGGYGNGGKPEGPHYPAGGAGAGIGGNGSGGLFDKIFAIPINVLQSVNTYLNQKQMHQGQPGVAAHGHHQNNGAASASASASAVSGSASYGNADKGPSAAVDSDYGHESAGAHGNGKAGASMMVQTKTNYDEIFNIPITALRSVQNLLNG